MKRRYNKNILKQKKRTKRRSKIRSKVKRTKKKRLSKKYKRQSGGAEKYVLEYLKQLQAIVDVKKKAADEDISKIGDGIKVLLKVNNGYKKCRTLKIIQNKPDGYYRVVFYAKDNDTETIKESFVARDEYPISDGVLNSILINLSNSLYEITLVGNCTRSDKYSLPGFMGGIGRRFSDDTSSGRSLITRDILKGILIKIRDFNKAIDDYLEQDQNKYTTPETPM